MQCKTILFSKKVFTICFLLIYVLGPQEHIFLCPTRVVRVVVGDMVASLVETREAVCYYLWPDFKFYMNLI